MFLSVFWSYHGFFQTGSQNLTIPRAWKYISGQKKNKSVPIMSGGLLIQDLPWSRSLVVGDIFRIPYRVQDFGLWGSSMALQTDESVDSWFLNSFLAPIDNGLSWNTLGNINFSSETGYTSICRIWFNRYPTLTTKNLTDCSANRFNIFHSKNIVSSCH